MVVLGFAVTHLDPNPSPLLVPAAHGAHSVVDLPGYSSHGTLEQPTSGDAMTQEQLSIAAYAGMNASTRG